MDIREERSGGAVKEKWQILSPPNKCRFWVYCETRVRKIIWQWEGPDAVLSIIKHFPHHRLTYGNCQFLQYTQFCSVFDSEPWWPKMTKEGLSLIEGSNVNIFTSRSLWNIMNICTSAKSLGTWRLEGPSFC